MIFSGNEVVCMPFRVMYKYYAIMYDYTRKAIYFSWFLRYNTPRGGESEKRFVCYGVWRLPAIDGETQRDEKRNGGVG